MAGNRVPDEFPFPGAWVHPDRMGGKICIEGTRFTVAQLVAEIAEEPGDELISLIDDHEWDRETVLRCLKGLADWLNRKEYENERA